RIVPRGPLQGLDEPQDGRQRRAQLMAGAGDKVGPHALDPPRRREIPKEQQDRMASARILAVCIESGDLHLEPPLDGNALRKVSLQRSSIFYDLVRGPEHIRAAQRE